MDLILWIKNFFSHVFQLSFYHIVTHLDISFCCKIYSNRKFTALKKLEVTMTKLKPKILTSFI